MSRFHIREMQPKQPPSRSITRAVGCFVISAMLFGWLVESIVYGRVAGNGRYGHFEKHGVDGVLAGIFILSVGCAITCFGFANLRPNRSNAYVLRAGVFGAVGIAILFLALILEGLGAI